ncbi:hypothetical protein [Leptolyngbya ohadii]|uniref:hypothetical protein n=1 Tax=Leptolyngbya ohadii TaxID=1962290 RepID=UPI000B5A1F84|nr:hypothetical protein [Leptolyngbya ohadii]
MEIERPNSSPLTEDDLQHLEKLEALLGKSIADGVITRQELNAIKVQIAANGKVMIEELDLVRKFIREKIANGELAINFFS